MSSLPFISHRLFVAAVEKQRRAPRQSARDARTLGDSEDQPTEVQLELLDSAELLSGEAVRRLGASAMLGGL